MYSNRTLKSANDFAPEYENYVMKNDWCGPGILFNIMKTYLKKSHRLLDLGIGTGLSSVKFYNYGLKITGIDGSAEMVKICQSKNITLELICHDLTKGIPTFNHLFEYIISYALFHMIEDLSMIFKNAANILTENGLFAFSIIEYNQNEKDFTESPVSGVYRRIDPASGIYNFRHTKIYIEDLLQKNKFKKITEKDFIGFKNPEEPREVIFKLYLTKKV